MATQTDLDQLENSFEKQLRIPGAKVSLAEVPDSTWNSIMIQNKNCTALKILGKSLISSRKTIELLVGVLWPRAANLQVNCAGELNDGSRLYLARFASEEDLLGVMNRSPWTVGGQLVIMAKFNPLIAVAEHKFEAVKIWMQLHGLPVCVATHKDIVLALAGKAGNPDVKTMVVFPSYVKVKVTINPDMQLVSGTFLKRPHEKPIPVVFKYEKAGIICYRCARLGHKEKTCQDPAFANNKPAAFVALEGIQASESPIFSSKDQANPAGVGGTSKPSPLIPKNLLADLEESLMGTGSKIAAIDSMSGIEPLPSCASKIGQLETALSTQKDNLNSKAVVLAVGSSPKVIDTKEVSSCRLFQVNPEPSRQVFTFQASKSFSLCVTPAPHKKQLRIKGPGPSWQRVAIGCLSTKKSKTTLSLSPLSDSSYEPSEQSESESLASSRKKLLEWSGSFGGFNEEDTGSKSESDYSEQYEASTASEAGVGAGKRSRSPAEVAEVQVQTSQSHPAWKRLKPEPSASA